MWIENDENLKINVYFSINREEMKKILIGTCMGEIGFFLLFLAPIIVEQTDVCFLGRTEPKSQI